jgi:hypothetical protein
MAALSKNACMKLFFAVLLLSFFTGRVAFLQTDSSLLLKETEIRLQNQAIIDGIL